MMENEFKAVVIDKAMEADGVVSVILGDPDGQRLPPWEPGAHVDLLIDGLPTKQYSLCGDPGDTTTYRLGVLRDAGGRGGSIFVHDSLVSGDIIQLRGPRNNFLLESGPTYLFIAGGIGITPLLPMMAAVESSGAAWKLVYGGRRWSSMAFLDEIATYGDKVSVRPEDDFGLLDLETILGSTEPDALIYCCGPEPLLRAVEEHCQGRHARGLRLERFAPKEVGEPDLSEAFEVVLARSDLALIVQANQSIASVAEAAGVEVLYSCAEGTCGTCETGVLEGVPDHRDSVLTQAEQDSNSCMMICVSRSCTPRLVLDL